MYIDRPAFGSYAADRLVAAPTIVVPQLLAVCRPIGHDATVEEAKKNGTHIVQPTETRNLILTALLNIFMRLQTMEQSNANSGTTLLLQQGNPNIKVD